MIFSLNENKEVLLSNNRINNISYIEEANNEFNKMVTSLSINESFGDNVVEIIKAIVYGFVSIIVKIFEHFKNFIIQLFHSDESIKHYKQELLKYNKDITIYDYNFYYREYSNFTGDIPNPNLYLQFSEEYEETVRAFEKISNLRSKVELTSKITDLTNAIDIDSNGRFANICRATALRSRSMITEDKYPDELYKLYRNGYTEKQLLDKESKSHKSYKITKQMVRQSASRFFEYKKTIDEVSKQKAMLVNAATDIINKFEKIDSSQFVSGTIANDYDINYAFTNFGKRKAAQLTMMCNIYTSAFSAKIEAMKEAHVQDRKVCFMAIRDILTGDND